MSTMSTAKVSVTPAEFIFVSYDAGEIADVVTELTELLGLPNPVDVVIDESTPLGKVSADVDGASSDATITINVESGALEDTKRFTHFNRQRARESLGRMLLRASDRQRADFADAPVDAELSLEQNAAWDAYCVGRLTRIGIPANQQRWLYNFRNRFGFSDATDAAFERLWSADDLGWSDLT